MRNADTPLLEYRRLKLDLSDAVRSLLDVARARDGDRRMDEARSLLVRLAEDRFQLAVVGQFSRGKSTLMNAVLGFPYLPTGALPMTSVITSVGYGSRPRAFIRREGTNLPTQVDLDDLVQFVSRASQDREDRHVVAAEVEVPAEILRLGFFFVDTPGVGSALTENTATTERFLPDADAVVFVTSFDSPLTAGEVTFLASVRSQVDRLFVVVNKLDLVSDVEAREVEAFVSDRLRSLDLEGGRVFATSARDALEAKQVGDNERLIASGVADLETALVEFLTNQKSHEFLVRTAGRARRLLTKLRTDIEIARRATEHAEDEAALRSFNESLVQLHRQLDSTISDLTEVVEIEARHAVSERWVTWSSTLEGSLTPFVDAGFDRAARGSAARALAESRRAIETAAASLVEAWTAERGRELQEVLARGVQSQRASVAGLVADIERAGAAAFGVRVEGEPSAVGSTPDLVLDPAPWSMPVRVPAAFHLLRAAWVEDSIRRRLVVAETEALLAHRDRVESSVLRATTRWTKHIEEQSRDAFDRAAERFRRNLQQPGADREVRELDSVDSRLAEIESELGRRGLRETSSIDTQESRAAASGHDQRATTNCVVCQRATSALFDHLAHAQFTLATVTDDRRIHEHQGGFCALHTWDLAELGSPLGLSAAYAGMAEAVARLLDSAATSAATTNALADDVNNIARREQCEACAVVGAAEQAAIDELTRGPDATRNGAGLCLSHLAQTVARLSDLEAVRTVVLEVASSLRRASEDMRTYALKREAYRRGALTDEEMTAYSRTLRRLVGHRALAHVYRSNNELTWS